jgi:hypothetical protein
MLVGTASAQTPQAEGRNFGAHMGRAQDRVSGVIGVVASINGSTLTVKTRGYGANSTATTYSVDVSTATFTKNGVSATLDTVAAGDTVLVVGPLNGTSIKATAIKDGEMFGRGGAGMMNRGMIGTVTAISGSTLTVVSKMDSNTTYTVNAANATVTKNGTASIVAGDTLMIQGAVSGTTVTATAINDGVPGALGNRGVKGNGQPIVGGKVVAINGSTLTITNQSNVTYSITVASTTITKAGNTASLSSIVIGDNVMVQGTINGTSAVASSVMDQGVAAVPGTPGTTESAPHRGGLGGIFGAIGGFFGHLFGF